TVQSAVRTLTGDGGPGDVDGTGFNVQIFDPYSISLDTAGNLFFEDGNTRFRKCIPNGNGTATGITSFIAGGFVNGNNFPEATGTAVDAAGNLYIADGNPFPGRIAKVTPAGVVST